MNPARAIIRVVNTAGPTSSPLNQFSLYRARTYPDEHTDLVTLFAPDPAVLELVKAEPFGGRLRVHPCGGSVARLARRLVALVATYRRAGVPVLVHLHHPSSAGLVLLQRNLLLRGVPALYTVHSTFTHYSRRNKALSRLNVALADRVTFVSETSRRAFPAGQSARKSQVIINGVDLSRIDEVLAAAPPRPTAAGAFELITVGRLVPAKDQARLLEVLAALPDSVALTVVGSGPLEAELKQQATALGVAQRVQFTGLVARDAVFTLMRSANLFVSTSAWEGLPVAVLEAMAVGLPTLLSDIGPHQELAARARGVFIAPDAPHRWAEAVTDLSARRAALRAFGAVNRASVEEHFSLRRMQADYTEVYEQLWAGARAR